MRMSESDCPDRNAAVQVALGEVQLEEGSGGGVDDLIADLTQQKPGSVNAGQQKATPLTTEAKTAATASAPARLDSRANATSPEEPTHPNGSASATLNQGRPWSEQASHPGAFRVEGTQAESSNRSANVSTEREESATEPAIDIPSSREEDIEAALPPSANTELLPLEAVMVDESAQRKELEEEIRRSIEDEVRTTIEQQVRGPIIENAVPADALDKDDFEGNTVDTKTIATRWFLGSFCLCLLLVALALGMGIGLPSSKNTVASPSEVSAVDGSVNDNRTTLERVQQRGYLKCGVYDDYTFTFADDGNNEEGLNVDQCRSMALIALGDPDLYEIVWVDNRIRFLYLADGTIDILTSDTTITMSRDVYEADYSRLPFTFTTPYYYAGLAFAGIPSFVDCADELDSFYGDCRALKICVFGPSSNLDALETILNAGVIVVVPDPDEMRASVRSGACQVVASDSSYLPATKAMFEPVAVEDDVNWKVGNQVFSKEPLCLVTRQDDPAWSAMANLVVDTFFLAEAEGITKDLVDNVTTSIVAGDSSGAAGVDLRSLASVLVSEFGHFGDLYERHIEPGLPRAGGPNGLYDKEQSTGLLYSFPFGRPTDKGTLPSKSGTLGRILEKGHLTCGVLPDRGPRFARRQQAREHNQTEVAAAADWSGFDVEFCRALAAAIFVGNSSRVRFVDLSAATEPNAYLVLANRDYGLDVVAGARITMQARYKEPLTKQGFAFSSPYYYDTTSHQAYAFVSRKDDLRWNDFVFWVGMAIVYAEEQNIYSESSVEMPVVELFGEGFKQMFRDCVFSVGNYAEVYNRTLQESLPRSGANRLYRDVPGPLNYPIPLN